MDVVNALLFDGALEKRKNTKAIKMPSSWNHVRQGYVHTYVVCGSFENMRKSHVPNLIANFRVPWLLNLIT